ncbi:MAG TPA: glutamate formimidoyltransferase [Gaiella sp.]|jgi:glutamate formiminotransferase/glutamate formiminotransferase/formiminotetrahydrofolate cyclodeaminase
MAPLESVPNLSEGRERSIVDAIAKAFGKSGARVLDVHLDPDHHRSVVTLVGEEQALEDGLVAGIDEARRRIDLRRHSGVHPRVGAADVVPVVPLVPDDLARALSVARAVARRTGEELGLPVFLYGELGEGRRPAFFRRGGLDELGRRIAAAELAPPHGPARLDPGAGAVLVGVRAPLVAFNLDLQGSLEDAQAIARAVRESSGGLAGVQALGLALGDRVQVSTNLVDIDATPLHRLVERVVEVAASRGARVGAGELVGLVPARCVVAAAHAGGVTGPVGGDGLPTTSALDAAAQTLHLVQLREDGVLEWHLRA